MLLPYSIRVQSELRLVAGMNFKMFCWCRVSPKSFVVNVCVMGCNQDKARIVKKKEQENE